MPIQVKLPNGQIGSFPDEMPHDQIEAVLQKQFGGIQAPEQNNLSGNDTQPQSFSNRFLRNVGAGTTRGLVDFANIPSQLAKAFESPMGKRQLTLPEGLSNKIHISEPDYSKMFGLKGDLSATDKAIQLGSEFISPFAELKGAQLGLKGLSKLPKYIEKISEVSKKLPLTQKSAGKPYGVIESVIDKANIKNFPVEKEDLDLAKKIFKAKHPFSHEAERILSDAKKGDYKGVFKLQETLKDIARDMKSSGSKLERKSAEGPNELASKILTGIQGHMTKAGLQKEAKLLGETTGNYRRYKKLEKHVYNPVKSAAKKGATGLGVGLSGLAGYKGIKSLFDDNYY